MRRLFTLALAMGVLGSALGTPARAQGDVTVQSTDPSWRGSYFNNPSLAGPSAHQRSDPEVAFNWGAGSPVPGVIGSDHFSARWERYYDVPGGLYRVDTTSDDGIRVKVDGRPVIDAWYPQAAQPRSAEVNLSAGHHLVVVEYFEQTGDANVRVGLVAVAGQPTGWAGKYYNNRDLAGAPAMTRTDLEINFDWRNGSPQPGTVGSDNFSVRWTRRLGLAPGSYRFSATTDDGVRLWVNEHLLIDRWYLQGATTVSGDIYVPGSADVRMEYFEATGNAVAKLVWSPVGGGSSGGQTIYVVQPGDTLYSIAKRFGTTVDAIKRANGLTSDAIYVGQRLVIPVGPTVPEVLVDNGTTGFATGGSASGWVAANAGYGGTMIWTLNNQVEQPSYNWARWYPALAPGRYEVFAYIPSVNANTHAAKYWVVHTGGFTSRVVDQYRYSNVWVSLGTYQFAGNGQEYVSLNDITGEPYASRRVGFDAVKWVPR